MSDVVFAPATTISGTTNTAFGKGRRFRAERRVRLGDVDVEGHLRLDAVARYTQDVGSDHMRSTGLSDAWLWVVRRTTVIVLHRPVYDDEVVLSTWCSGTGAAWAERRVTVAVGGRPALEVSGLWVCLDRDNGRPIALDRRFEEVFGLAEGGQRVPGRLTHPGRPHDTEVRTWPLRHSDFDSFRHLNNAVTWELVEDQVTMRHPTGVVRAAEVEYRSVVEPGSALTVYSATDAAGDVGIWVTDDSENLCTTAMVQLEARPTP